MILKLLRIITHIYLVFLFVSNAYAGMPLYGAQNEAYKTIY